jgi:branched-chain amino acid aminotransferase
MTTIQISTLQERAVKETRSLPFGKVPTEHMFVAVYAEGQWKDARISPFEDLLLSPLALCLHYGQTVFEGMKAFRMADGRINIFRPKKHYERFVRSLERMCMPAVPYDLFMGALDKLVDLDRDWVPTDADGALYLRPFVIATEARIGIKASDEYLFTVVATPAYQYYAEPLNVKVEMAFARAFDGGTGTTKCGGNYGGSLYPAQRAHEEGFDQVIWTDAQTHRFIEESGTMNLMFYWDGRLLTPPLSGTILDGVTRDSLLTLAAELGIPAEERQISWEELEAALAAGRRVEAFGAGTGAVVAPIRSITIHGIAYECFTGSDAVMYRLRDALQDIRMGNRPDLHGWNHIL